MSKARNPQVALRQSKFYCPVCGFIASVVALKLVGDKLYPVCPKCGQPILLKIQPRARRVVVGV